MSETTIKFFTATERKAFFKELERRRLCCATKTQASKAIRNEAIFRIMHYCALRVTEVTNLLVEDYNPINHEMYCRRLKGGRNNTLRIIDPDVLKALNRHLRYNKPHTYLFENTINGTKMSRKTLDGIMRATCKGMTVHQPKREKWHCHTLRHTKAIELAEMGFDLKELQYWLGHAEVSNTLIYFTFTSKQRETMYRKLKQ